METRGKSCVLIIGSDEGLRRWIGELLRGEGLEVVEEADGDAVMARVIEQDPALIIMVEEEPPVWAVELLPLLRRLTRTPVVVINGGGETEIVEALLQGADIYLAWPLNSQELVCRVRALFRRQHPSPIMSGTQG